MEATYHDYELAPTFSQVSAVYSKNPFLESQRDGVPLLQNKMFLPYV